MIVAVKCANKDFNLIHRGIVNADEISKVEDHDLCRIGCDQTVWVRNMFEL